MGECNYYLKARFRSKKSAAGAVPRLTELLKQGEAARDYWQRSRPHTPLRKDGGRPISSEVFWVGIRERFPLVHGYLKELADTPDWDNGLAGQFSCLVDPSVPRRGDPQASLFHEDDTLFLKLSGIWHCAEMGRLERYCVDDLGAVAAGSISEEDFELDEEADAIDDWEFFDAIEI